MNTPDLEELERLLAKATQEQSDIDYYAGGSSVNYSQRELGAWMMLNGKSLIATAREVEGLRRDLAAIPCQTVGAEDHEPGCCAPCRARAALEGKGV